MKTNDISEAVLISSQTKQIPVIAVSPYPSGGCQVNFVFKDLPEGFRYPVSEARFLLSRFDEWNRLKISIQTVFKEVSR